jgi:hypothetical protein
MGEGGTMQYPRISAESFYEAFIREWEVARAEGDLEAGDNPWMDLTWTRFIQEPGGFLERVMRRVETPGFPLHYRKEWYKVDALYVGGEDLFETNLNYPSSIQVLIEHEHNEDIEREMWNLLHWRAPLKVIISYDWSEEEKTTPARIGYMGRKIGNLLKGEYLIP